MDKNIFLTTILFQITKGGTNHRLVVRTDRAPIPEVESQDQYGNTIWIKADVQTTTVNALLVKVLKELGKAVPDNFNLGAV